MTDTHEERLDGTKNDMDIGDFEREDTAPPTVTSQPEKVYGVYPITWWTLLGLIGIYILMLLYLAL